MDGAINVKTAERGGFLREALVEPNHGGILGHHLQSFAGELIDVKIAGGNLALRVRIKNGNERRRIGCDLRPEAVAGHVTEQREPPVLPIAFVGYKDESFIANDRTSD